MIFDRPVNPRASRMVDIVASVPLLHIRTFSTDGTILTIRSAISTSEGPGVPKLVPLDKASDTASRMAGLLCPRMEGPQVHT